MAVLRHPRDVILGGADRLVWIQVPQQLDEIPNRIGWFYRFQSHWRAAYAVAFRRRQGLTGRTCSSSGRRANNSAFRFYCGLGPAYIPRMANRMCRSDAVVGDVLPGEPLSARSADGPSGRVRGDEAGAIFA